MVYEQVPGGEEMTIIQDSNSNGTTYKVDVFGNTGKVEGPLSDAPTNDDSVFDTLLTMQHRTEEDIEDTLIEVMDMVDTVSGGPLL